MYIICSDSGQPLREELAKSPQKILANAFPQFFPQSDGSNGQPSSSIIDEGHSGLASESFTGSQANLAACSDAYFHGLYLIRTLVKLMPEWLHGNHTVLDTLLLVWKSPARIARLQNEQELSLLQVSHAAFEILFSITSTKNNSQFLCFFKFNIAAEFMPNSWNKNGTV